MTTAPRRNRGFTLIEIAVVLVIVGLLLGGLLLPLGTQQELRRVTVTQTRLDEAREALYGYAVANGALPCPDTDNDGVENSVASACTAQEGSLPWATLGTAQGDEFGGNRFRYRIATALDDHGAITCTTAGDINVCSGAAGATCAAGEQIALNVGAVVLSHGKNGFGATNNAGNPLPGPTGPDEVENSDTDSLFVSRTASGVNAANGEFDDVVTFLPMTLLCSRLIQGGGI